MGQYMGPPKMVGLKQEMMKKLDDLGVNYFERPPLYPVPKHKDPSRLPRIGGTALHHRSLLASGRCDFLDG